jgi:ElaB/YqjD/DUF883 family membrane-anchored ribosome-binding protein
MPTNSPSIKGSSSTQPSSNVADQMSDVASHAKEKAAELGRTAANKIDEQRDTAASGLQSAASTLHAGADRLPGGETVTSLAHTAADTLTSTADYVREHDVNRMMADVERLVRNNPGPSLVAAAVVGFLVGRSFSSHE